MNRTFIQEFLVSQEMLADESAWNELKKSIQEKADKRGTEAGLTPHPYYRANADQFTKVGESAEVEGFQFMPGYEVWRYTGVYEAMPGFVNACDIHFLPPII